MLLFLSLPSCVPPFVSPILSQPSRGQALEQEDQSSAQKLPSSLHPGEAGVLPWPRRPHPARLDSAPDPRPTLGLRFGLLLRALPQTPASPAFPPRPNAALPLPSLPFQLLPYSAMRSCVTSVLFVVCPREHQPEAGSFRWLTWCPGVWCVVACP